MELDGTSPSSSYLNFNESKDKLLNIQLIKQEIPDSDDVKLKLLQQEGLFIKSEKVSTEDKFKSTFDTEVTNNKLLELKSEAPAQGCYVETDENISVKQELLHEEFEIKCEDEEIYDDKYNSSLQHVVIPTDVTRFKCNFCDYSCQYNSILKIHLRKHTGEKPFKCNICDYSCGQKNMLKNHLRQHSGEKPFKCNICDNSFGHASHLKSHVQIHIGEKPFKCNICDYSCIQKSNLARHLRSHSGEKPFQCTICNYSCGLKGSLKIHMRTHTGEKPFTCNICDSSFSQQGDLKNHLKTHSGEKPFTCSICDYSCIQKSALKRHLILRHTL